MHQVTSDTHCILTVSSINEIEKAYETATPPLMSLAGLSIAARVKKLCPDLHTSILIVVGPGNNGADAVIAAAHLYEWGYKPAILTKRNPQTLPAEALSAWQRWESDETVLYKDFPKTGQWQVIIDGIFGIGLDRPVEGHYADWIDFINIYYGQQTLILSVDIPSGLNADTGSVMGTAVHAIQTISFIAYKPGLLTNDGPDCCGEITIDTLSVEIEENIENAGLVSNPSLFQGILPLRRKNTHKGDYGTVGVIGGADGMVGALLLSARAAVKLGAGKVIAGSLAKHSPVVDYLYPEIMVKSAQRLTELVSEEAIDDFDVLVLGPGMGELVYTGTPIIRTSLLHTLPIVLDADALNQIAVDQYLQKMITERKAVTIMTPHPGEAARLLDASVDWVQSDRLRAAKTLSEQFNAIVVLKGSGTVITAPDGRWFINRTGNPGMASGGMGDCLTGMIAALMAQGVDPFMATGCAVCLHGAAADACLYSGVGPIGLTASDIIDNARGLLNRLC